MAYEWKSEKIVLVTLPPGRFEKEEPANGTKEYQVFGGTFRSVKNGERLPVPVSWEQRHVCRSCGGGGCQGCNGLGYFIKNRNDQLQVAATTQNGAWTRFVGWGDERPDLCGFGDIIVLFHIQGAPKPEGLDPALGSTYDSRNAGDFFGSFFGSGPVPVMAKFSVTRREAASGCGKNIALSVREVCSACKGRGRAQDPTSGMCGQCHGAGLVQKEKHLLLQIPPGTKNNTTITLRQAGNAQMVDGVLQTGDVHVKIKVKLF